MLAHVRIESGVAIGLLMLLACGDDAGLRTARGQPDAAVDGPARPDAGTETAPDTSAPSCGNGTFDPGEECDDGNVVSGDGCSWRCRLEDPSPCSSGLCTADLCGDGRRRANEVCDDGNAAGGDGCSADCQTIERGWRCRVPGRRCTPICGDRVLEGTESCDDGNLAAGDGCSVQCLTEPGWDCSAGPCVPMASVDGGVDGGSDGGIDGGAGWLYCGDGIVSGAEECDDGVATDDNAYDACTSACVFGSFCGDGMVNGEETCDLGEQNGTVVYGQYGCTLGCTNSHFCGDGMVDTAFGEECDLGEKNGAPVSNSGAASVVCTTLCRLGQSGPVI